MDYITLLSICQVLLGKLQGFSEFKHRPGDSHLLGTGGSQKMARYGSLSVFLTGRSRVAVTWVNSLKSPGQADHFRRKASGNTPPLKIMAFKTQA